MAKNPKPRTINLPRGGFGHMETGVIKATVVSQHVLGNKVIEMTRYKVLMNNQRAPFGAAMRFTFGNAALAMEVAA